MLTKRQSKRISSSYKKSESSTGKCGFTLVELLIVIVVGLIITAGVVSIMWVYIFDFEQTDDITAARQRGEMVLSIMEGPILHAGLAMPDSADQFDGLSIINSWTGPIDVDSDEIRIIYSVPSNIYADTSADFAASTDLTLGSELDLKDYDGNPIDLPIANTLLADQNNIKGWALFPTANIPFKVGNSKLTPVDEGIIAQYDNLHFLRALEAKVETRQFKVKDIVDNTSSFQPRVDGVEKIFFELTGSNVLSVYVLTRGNKQGVDLDPNRSIPGWPTAAGYTDVDRTYRLSVTKGSWRIRN